jgi:hypothetical protein
MTTGEWISVDDRLPKCPKINGFWDDLPVIVKPKGSRPVGAYFTYSGGDDVYPDKEPFPSFSASGGIPMDISHWMKMPDDPKTV